MDGLVAQRTALLVVAILMVMSAVTLNVQADDREADRLEKRLDKIEDRIDDASAARAAGLQAQADALRAQLAALQEPPPPPPAPEPVPILEVPVAPPTADQPASHQGPDDGSSSDGSDEASPGSPSGDDGSSSSSGSGSSSASSAPPSSGSAAAAAASSAVVPPDYGGVVVRPAAAFDLFQEGDVAVVDARASTSPFGPIIAYHWDWGDGTTTSTTEPRTSHAYANAWPLYHVTLLIVDATNRNGLAWHTLDWNPSKASFIEPVTKVEVRGLSVRVDATPSLSENVIVRYVWDWGDGSRPVESPIASHTYTDAGEYLILIELTDSTGATSLEHLIVDVHLPPGEGPRLASQGGVRSDEPRITEVLFGTAGHRLIEESPAPDLVPLSILGAILVGAVLRRRG